MVVGEPLATVDTNGDAVAASLSDTFTRQVREPVGLLLINFFLRHGEKFFSEAQIASIAVLTVYQFSMKANETDELARPGLIGNRKSLRLNLPQLG